MNSIIEKIKKMPTKPGIYLFYKGEELVYVGKATSLRNRVRSYLRPKTSRPIEALIGEVTDIKWKETESVLEALILEANYIKKFKPRYNIKEKDDKSWNFLVITKDDFPKLEAVRERNLGQEKKRLKYIFGPYAEMKTSAILKLLHSLFKVSRCDPGQKRPCFDYQLGKCLGVCTNEIDKQEYKDKVVNPLVLFLKGKKKAVLRSLNKKMKEASKMQDFEEAKRLRNQIFSLQKIRDFSLLDKSFLNDDKELETFNIKRIEAYDISNLGTDAKTGSMVVFNDKGPVKSEYKKFKIKTVIGQSDVDCLREVISRRIKHLEWPLPDIILVDGGLPQVHAVKDVLEKDKIKIFVFGIAKGRERKKNELVFIEKNERIINWIKDNMRLMVKARNEAHRFAVSYQRKLSIKRLIKDR